MIEAQVSKAITGMIDQDLTRNCLTHSFRLSNTSIMGKNRLTTHTDKLGCVLMSISCQG